MLPIDISSFQKPTQKLCDLSHKIIFDLSSGNFSDARQAFDELRLLRSLYSDLFIENVASLQHHHEQKTKELEYLTNSIQALISNLEVIENWQNLVKKEFSLNEIHSDEVANLLIDIHLPPTWNWQNDVVILHESTREVLASRLLNRGQVKIITLGKQANPENKIASTEEDVERLFEGWRFSKDAQTCVLFEPKDQSEANLVRCVEDLTRQANMRVNTTIKFSKNWVINHIRNLKEFPTAKSLNDFRSIIQGQKVAIISPGPSLGKNINLVNELKGSHFLVAPVQTAQALLKHDIIPDFFIVVDPTNYSSVLDDFPVQECAGIVVMEACHNDFISLPFRNKYIINSNMFRDIVISSIGGELKTSAGSSVSTHAAIMCAELGCTEIVLLGQDLAIGARHYYFRSGFDNEPGPITAPPQPKAFAEFTVPGWNGEQVRSRSDYYVYLKEFELLAARLSGSVALINCTEGGAFINGFQHLSLKDHLATIEESMPIKRPLERSSTELEHSGDNELLKAVKQEIQTLRATIKLCKRNSSLAPKIISGDNSKLEIFEKNERLLNSMLSNMHWLPNFIMAESARIIRRLAITQTLEDNIKLTQIYLKIIEKGAKEIQDALLQQLPELNTREARLRE